MTCQPDLDATTTTCAVTYRGTAANGEDAEIRLYLDPAAATLADAWERLTARYGRVDPRSIEIQLREVAQVPGQVSAAVQHYA